MRRLAAAILAAPVIASIYVRLLVSVPSARRYVAGTLAIVVVGFVGITLAAPTPASSIPPSHPTALAADQLRPVETFGASGTPDASAAGGSGVAAIVADATADTTSANAGTPVVNPTPGSDTIVTAAARGTSVGTAATVRAVTTAKVAGSKVSGNRVRLDTAIVVRFDRAVTLSSVKAALAIKPAIKGTIKPATAATTNKVFLFTPATPLAVNTAYTVSFAKAIKDKDGVAVATPKPVRLLTASAPALVRFRPAKGATAIDETQVVSVRFTKPMNTATTAKAFSVVVNGKKVSGKITWAENNTVLVFTPTKAFVKGSGVGVRLLGTATSADGVAIKKGGSATFKVVPGPVVVASKATASKPVPKPVVKPIVKPKPPSGGGSVGGGAWAAAERYYLKLMNCTRTGGYVTSSGSCASPGGRSVAPLWIDAGISAKVSRPYAKYLASSGICSHFADGNPGHRLSRAGYHSYKWAENISCPKSMDVTNLMVYTQRYFQAEGWGGGHYVNLMNAQYDRVGIGVWVAHGRAEVVIDFYRP